MSDFSEREISWFERPKEIPRVPDQSIDFERVERKHEILFVGDNHGSFRGLLKNLSRLQCIEITFVGKSTETLDPSAPPQKFERVIENIEEYDLDSREEALRFFRSIRISWTGGNRKLLCLGDILADRNGQGDLVIEALALLKGQALESGGDIIMDIGNHDVYWLATLQELTTDNGFRIDPAHATFQELEPFVTERFKKRIPQYNAQGVVEVKEFEFKNFDREKIFNSQAVLKHIEFLKKMSRIAHIEDDTLFIHADVDEKEFMVMVQTNERIHYNKTGAYPTFVKLVEIWNNSYRTTLQKSFPMKEGNLDVDAMDPTLFKTFFGDKNQPGKVLTGTSTTRQLHSVGKYSQKFEHFLKTRGINALVIGHSYTPKPDSHGMEITIVPADGMSDKSGPNDNYGSGKIKTNASIEFYHRTNSYTLRDLHL